MNCTACELQVVARGLCGKHYQAATKYDRLPPLVVDDSCSGPVVARGLCYKHWRRAKKAGAFTPNTHRPRGLMCEKDGCERTARAGGLCQPHYRLARGYKTPPTSKSQNAEIGLRKGRAVQPQQSLNLRMLARTCNGCGDLITTPDHLLHKGSGPIPVCSRCAVRYSVAYTNSRKLVDEKYSRALRQRADRVKKRLNDASRTSAVHHNDLWTSAELEVVSRADLTAREAGALIGRTYYAVKHKRADIKKDPRTETLLGQVYETANKRAEHVAELVDVARLAHT